MLTPTRAASSSAPVIEIVAPVSSLTFSSPPSPVLP